MVIDAKKMLRKGRNTVDSWATVGADQQERYLLVCEEFDAHHVVRRAAKKLTWDRVFHENDRAISVVKLFGMSSNREVASDRVASVE